MYTKTADHKASVKRLRDILLDYLQAGTVVVWPGVDGFTIDDVLNCYPQAVAAGEVPDWQELRLRYPDLTAELQGFLEARGLALKPGPAVIRNELGTKE